MKYGVPQGSLLGPRLFKIYVDDLPDNITEGWLYMFADDTTAYVVADNIDATIGKLNRMANEIQQWCGNNKLTANIDKTEAMIITQGPFIGPTLPIRFGESQIKVVSTTKSLGVEIDNKLTWKKQLRKVTKSFGAKLSQLRKMKYLSKHVLEEIYYKSMVSNVTYGILVWGTCSPALLNDLEHYHVRAAKMIYNITKDDLTDEQILQKAKWEPLNTIYKRRILTLMHDIYYMKAPQELQELFTKRTGRTGRGNLNFDVVRCKTEIGRTSLRYRGPIAWNQLSEDDKKITNRDTFKLKLKNDLESLNKISFLKEAAVNNNKKDDFIYF